MKSRIVGMMLGAALVLAPISAIAADSQQGPLAPAGAAGVQNAQDWSWDNNKTAYVIGGAAVVAAVITIASDNNSHHHSASSTSTGTH